MSSRRPSERALENRTIARGAQQDVRSCGREKRSEEGRNNASSERTLDIPVQLALAMQVLETLEQLAADDCDVVLLEDARLELLTKKEPDQPAKAEEEEEGQTRSPHDPPCKNSMTIQSSVPRSHDPSYLVTKGESSEERMEISD